MSDHISSTQVSTAEPTKLVTIFGSVAAACTALVTALALIPGVPGWVVGAVGAAAAVSTAVVGYLTKQTVTAQTTPWQDVLAKVTPSGKHIAGPAAEQPTGSTVSVVQDTSPPAFQPGGVIGDGDPL